MQRGRKLPSGYDWLTKKVASFDCFVVSDVVILVPHQFRIYPHKKGHISFSPWKAVQGLRNCIS